MSPIIRTSRLWWPLAIILATLFLSGCFNSDSDKGGAADNAKGAQFHGAEWATIKNLDPRGEQCIDCHGRNADMAPFSGGVAHNIGLKKYDTPEQLGVAGLKITSAEVVDGKVTFSLNQALPADATYNATFAKLAPRVRHNRGHDWQNYLNSGSAPRGGTDGAVLDIGLAPQMATQRSGLLTLSSDRRSLSFDLKDPAYNWGEHTFTVTDKEANTYAFTEIGTKVKVEGLSEHINCHAGHKDALQIGKDGTSATLICWWPDGTALPAGVFVSDEDEFIVAYQDHYTHRVTLLIGGRPSYNTWFDFIPDGSVLDVAGYSPEEAAQDDPAGRDIVDIQSCNSCHDSLAMSPGVHGGFGSRSETQTCVTCHNPGNLQPSTGRSVDFKQLVHRIHRGANLPSIDGTITSTVDIENAKGGHGLLSAKATDWTKVRFPQGPIPGQASGITNCVKCHMGAETKRMVQELANEVGSGADYNVQEKLKLAKVTPQGDNWLSVRNIEACRGCHDSQIWSNGSGRGTPADPTVMEEAVPLYGSKYLNIGYDWIGFKGDNEGDEGAPHANRTVAVEGNMFSCGSNGGCHGNTKLSDINIMNPGTTRDPLGDNTIAVGDNGSNKIHRRHLRLTRDFIIAERFAIKISNPKVAGSIFTADVNIKDNKTGSYLTFNNDLKTIPDTDIGELSLFGFLSNGYIGWMHNSPDYNHSAGHNNSLPFLDIPGAPVLAPVDWVNGKISVDLADIPNDQWATIKDDLANVVGTLFVRANFNEGYNLQAATVDFRFDNKVLAADEGRRKVVDFTAGRGVEHSGWGEGQDGNTQSCSSCHLQLSFHGGLANNVQACVVCHNPQRTDINGRSVAGKAQKDYADGQYEESLDFKRFVHAIHAAGDGFRQDPLIHDTGFGAPDSRPGNKSNSFPGVLSNCQTCHIKNDSTGKWTFELDQIPEGMIGSTAITADWATITPSGGNYDPDNQRSDLSNHLKMSPIASVCSSCHDAGYKTGEGRMNENIIDGGPYVGSHWWVMGGIAPGVVPEGAAPKSTKHQSGK